MSIIELQTAFVLHSRPYRDSSLIIDFFTLNHGRISAVARGVRAARSHSKALLQPFSPIVVSCVGKGELLTLRKVEEQSIPYRLFGEVLISGLYLNELLQRLLPRFDPYPHLFQAYQTTLTALAKEKTVKEMDLRRFEKTLLKELGYAVSLSHELHNGVPLQADQYYHYQPNSGVALLNGPHSRHNNAFNQYVFLGKHLLAIEQDQLQDSLVLRDAKRLMRLALHAILGHKPLQSRQLLQQSRVYLKENT